MKDNLLEGRVLDKFEIEREYWERKGVSPIVYPLPVPRPSLILDVHFLFHTKTPL
ncbi:hypothetical protein KO561_00835 [Radiobacillus kanasensis]|nr:hypothetical protein KO561_00835 [Radiobacillus kanasensis]